MVRRHRLSPALGAALLHTGTSDPTVEVMDGGLGASASRGWPPHGETELTGDRLQIGQCAGDGGHRNDNTIIYHGQRAEAEIQNGQLVLHAIVHSRRLTERGGVQLLSQVIEAMEVLSTIKPLRPLLPAHTDEGGGDTFAC